MTVMWAGRLLAALALLATTLSATGVEVAAQSVGWRRAAPSPIPARAAAAGVWTGREMIVLGGQHFVRARRFGGLERFGASLVGVSVSWGQRAGMGTSLRSEHRHLAGIRPGTARVPGGAGRGMDQQ